ncbi:hypothetical protein E2R60_19895 [Paenibacillus dendritiformis]|uniref:acyltransferase family protein n=1 Tax=Paenibacillus dendritiformis TaxID=130049 RepID=UPI00105A56A4|nr:acyltransferase family protein [Paenibacillus dendritiformis]TDL51871.1 hypothetical protein E2R60_19895 [Paenibacillus dendritiformis]
MNKRIDYLDTAKGIGILLVVFGHALTVEDSAIKVYLYSFHLPLFFFISGFLYRPEKFKNYFSFLGTKARALIMPYITFSVMSHFMILIMHHKSGQHSSLVFLQIKNVVYGDGQHLAQLNNVALWFLPCLFIVENIFYWVVKFSKNHSTTIVTILLMTIIGFVYSKNYNHNLPWSLNVALIALGFYGVGYIGSKYTEVLEKHLLNMNSYYVICIFLVSFIVSMMNGRIDMNGNSYGHHIIYFYVAAFSGISTVLKLSTKLRKLSLINYLGRNSLVILGLHFLMFQLIANYQLQRILFNDFFKVQEEPLTMIILYTVLGTLMTLPFAYLINRFVPFLFGKKSHKQSKNQLMC